MSKTSLTKKDIYKLSQQHTWAAEGVSDYPPLDPLVGQSTFFNRFKTFIHTVDHEADNFAHVFAVEGEWGLGKSRLGHELIAQINDCSKGWFVRDESYELHDSGLFDTKGFEHYLGLYIRYSQVVSEFQNSDNWFGFGLYRALIPLATKAFDNSIQSEIAKQSLRRLESMGFESDKLAEHLQLAKQHDDQTLYEDSNLVTELVRNAHKYLQNFGIRYVLVVLDELETVAEAATFGLEADDARQLDGQAIRLIGKAIKEEDPRRKLPWLRYVALCSPLLGQQLREIQSVARRFELVELEQNAFSDVSDYLSRLRDADKLRFDYPVGLVEAAYAMSGANFGWFNVIMANVDVVLEQYENAGRPIPAVGEVFEAVLAGSGRVEKHVLDRHAIEGIRSPNHTMDQELLKAARHLLYGQLPVSLNNCPQRTRELLNHENEDSEPVASLYCKVKWDAFDCRRALEEAKFQRQQDKWFYPSVDQGISLKTLIQNLRTFAISETETNALLIPLSLSEFKHLVVLLYDHPAAEFAADALWHKLLGTQLIISDEEATHIGPSVAMLLKLDLRYRRHQHNSMIFREPALADAHEQAMKDFEQAWSQDDTLRFRTRLTGLFRLLDKNWQYAEESLPNNENLVIQMAPRGHGKGSTGGLFFCDALKLHPKNMAWFAWVNSKKDLQNLHTIIARTREESGRFPVMAFTASIGVADYYHRGGASETLKDDIIIYQLNISENDMLERIGLLPQFCTDFDMNEGVFTGRFKNRLNALRDFAYQAIHAWRRKLNDRGLIAYPLRAAGKMNPNDRDLLFRAWHLMAVKQPEIKWLNDLLPEHDINADDLANLFSRLVIDRKLQTIGFEPGEQAGFFADMENPSRSFAQIPCFLAKIANPASPVSWDINKAMRDWYWGYLWSGSGLSPKSIFEDWMWWCSELHLYKIEDSNAKQGRWISLTRAELENTITEAVNWFDANDEGYRAEVKILERVYGYDRIPALFAPLGSSPVGTETVEADDRIKNARQLFDRLKIKEESLTSSDNLEDIVKAMPSILQARSELLTQVEMVKPRNPKVKLDKLDNLKTISLDNKKESLFERVTRARMFADRVVNIFEKICFQTDKLIKDINEDCRDLNHFPKNLFILSLETVRNIVEGALQQSRESETARQERGAGSDTLLHFLRSLQLDKAAERLELLLSEVGCSAGSEQIKPLSDIEGHIISAYSQCKKQFQDVQKNYETNSKRIDKASEILESLPRDYEKQEDPAELVKLHQKLLLIKDAFEELTEQAQNERERFSQQARKGNFKTIRDIPERLLKPVRDQISVTGGELNKIENRIDTYRKNRLVNANGDLLLLFNPLFSACGKSPVLQMSMDEIKNDTLHNLNVKIDLREQNILKKAETLLKPINISPVNISIDRWKEIAREIINNRSPELSPDEHKALVDKKIIRVRYAFGEQR
ncbi:Uncharacterized protein dnl_09220 [Desulfonema limicola]|uniref:Uncharacterized protein n=1 Tax=Desulfonema limicola TaxID=45656 RepID=A0A975B4K5_9BACT|nr:hypothetical protein [Desulfonema limicola]QTA78692.1 Uncharacterized protein dnl_09220 [Desulfonema limicola]